MFNLRSLAGPAATVAIVLVAWSCDTQPEALGPTIGPPLYGVEAKCIPFKMTGGGRIDYPPGTATKNPPARQEFQTFGAHVIGSGEEKDGKCLAEKGSLQWIDHRPEFRINGRPLNLHSIEITFAETFSASETCSDGAAHWGGRVVLRNTGQTGTFEVFDCDDGEPGQGNDGFEISTTIVVNGAPPYSVLCPFAAPTLGPPACTLTGGNRQFHPTP
jgi:hypothetical protein